MERQKHGFDFENQYIKKYNLLKEENYTASFDAYKNKIPYQIKLIKKDSSIDLGDIFRNANKQEDFYLVIGFWENNKTSIIKIYKIFIPYKKWNKLLCFDYYKELKLWIKNVSNSYSYDKQWKQEMKYWKDKYNEINRKIAIRFKRDHKSQKRIQCAINSSIFYNYFLKEFEWEENTL